MVLELLGLSAEEVNVMNFEKIFHLMEDRGLIRFSEQPLQYMKTHSAEMVQKIEGLGAKLHKGAAECQAGD